MKRSLAVLLRKLANRLDPPRSFSARNSLDTSAAKDYRLTFLP